jgi:hypothetical protein
MRKLLLTTAAVAAICFAANAQTTADEQKIIQRIPAGYRLHSINGEKQILRGDLNGDGADDYAVIIREAAASDEAYPARGILIFFKDGDDYKLVLENRKGLGSYDGKICINCGNRMISFEIKKGNLYIIYHTEARFNDLFETFTFRYKNSEFELIGYDNDDDTWTRSINFATKKKLDSLCPQDDKCKKTWTTFTMKEPILLRKITDFTTFDFYDYMKMTDDKNGNQK